MIASRLRTTEFLPSLEETHFRAEAVGFPRYEPDTLTNEEERNGRATQQDTQEERDDVRPERVACAHRLLTNFTRRASSTISCFRLCPTAVRVLLALSPSRLFISAYRSVFCFPPFPPSVGPSRGTFFSDWPSFSHLSRVARKIFDLFFPFSPSLFHPRCSIRVS